MKVEFGRRLREARERKGLTQLELAKQANLGESTISFYELGRREPSYEVLLRLAEILEVNPAYLLSGNNHQTPWWEKDEPPNAVELEEFIRNHSNIKLMGNPLDERAKEDVLLFLRAAYEHIQQEKKRAAREAQRGKTDDL